MRRRVGREVEATARGAAARGSARRGAQRGGPGHDAVLVALAAADEDGQVLQVDVLARGCRLEEQVALAFGEEDRKA